MTEYVKALAMLPADEARDLAVRAAKQGVTTPELLGIMILASAYGLDHPEVMTFLQRSNVGQLGP